MYSLNFQLRTYFHPVFVISLSPLQVVIEMAWWYYIQVIFLNITWEFCLLVFQNKAIIARITNLSDTVIHLESFIGSNRETNPLYKDYHGKQHPHDETSMTWFLLRYLEAFCPFVIPTVQWRGFYFVIGLLNVFYSWPIFLGSLSPKDIKTTDNGNCLKGVTPKC